LDLIELKRRGKIKKIIVYGCLIQRYKSQILKYVKEIDAIVGRLDVNGLEDRTTLLTSNHFAYVKLSEGCGNACSYCAIPFIKGNLISRKPEAIICEIQSLEKRKVKEINLIGQDITLYGKDLFGSPHLTFLIKKILRSCDIPWIRLLYLHPAHITNDLLELIAKEKRICKYLDLPIQHINNRLLKLMHRNITEEAIVKLISKIRKAIKGVFLRTSIIVGFPSETEKEFLQLLNFIKDVKFERLGAFIYSREENTKAYYLRGQIPHREKQKRFDEIMLTQQNVALEVNKKMLGAQKMVLIDEQDSQQSNLFLGRTEYDAPEVDGLVYLKTQKDVKVGEFYKVKIIDTLEYDLVGEVI